MTSERSTADERPTVTASIDPQALGPLFVQGNLIGCTLDVEGRTVWRWSNGIVLSLNTDTMHWHVSVERWAGGRAE